MEHIIGLMENNIMDGGLTVNKMDMEYSYKQIINIKRAYGKTGKRLNGLQKMNQIKSN